MHVAVVIVGFRNPQDIAGCLSRLQSSDHHDYEVVICENGGRDAVRALAALLPERLAGGQPVRILDAGSNLGYAGGVNAGMRASSDADAWWILNPDTEPESAALASLLERLQAGDCDAVGGAIYLPDRRIQTCGGRWVPWLARPVSIGRGGDIDAAVNVEVVEHQLSYISGACMLVSRRFLEQTGPMREDYFLYCEEVEWCLRAQSLGLRLGFAAGARVLHHSGSTTGSGDEIKRRPRMPIYLDERNKILVTRDCFPARTVVAATAALALLIGRFARRGAWRQLGYALSGWAAGVGNRRGMPAWVAGAPSGTGPLNSKGLAVE